MTSAILGVPKDLADVGPSLVIIERALLGVPLVGAGLRPSTVIGGTVMSDGVTTTASAHGLLNGWSGCGVLPVLLSLLLSRILFGSPRTAGALDNPAESDALPEFEPASRGALVPRLVVSSWRPRGGCGEGLLVWTASSSTQSAGVGGTGPSVDAACGLRVG